MTVIRFEENTKSISLEKGPKESFGICIVRGEVKDSPTSKVTGIFIKDIVPQTPAHRCGKLKIGDRILYVNENDVRNATEQIFVSYIKEAGLSLTLKIQTFDSPQSGGSGPKKPSENGFVSNGEALPKKGSIKMPSKQPESTTAGSVAAGGTDGAAEAAGEDEEDEVDTRDMTGRTHSAAGYEIDRASAGNVKRSKTELQSDTETEDEFGYTLKKIKKRYGNLGTVHKAEVVRPPNTDIGLALVGHKDRQTMACVVAGINPNGLLTNVNIKSGDQILEVNGTVLLDRCHLNASGVFKNLAGEKIAFVLLRRPMNKCILPIKPVTQFPATTDETEYLFKTYKNVRLVQVQKVGVSIGIMIIEGKHVEVGAGIFVSDLQEGSAAEEAGLKVGEMILAINKDVIVDTNYDTAAGILKRASGIVNLVMCSLKKEDEEAKKKEEEKEKEKKKEEKPPEPEKPQDPSVAEIKTNKKTLIEIKVEKKPLGCMVVGGKKSFVTTGVVITNVYADGAIANDKRLQVFDQIIELNGTPLNAAELSANRIYQMFNLPYETVKMMVWRNDPPEIETITLDVARKPGKDLGLALVGNPKGVMVSEIISAGCADIDSRMQRGDLITKLNGDSLENTSMEACCALFRGATGKVNFEIIRPKPTART